MSPAKNRTPRQIMFLSIFSAYLVVLLIYLVIRVPLGEQVLFTTVMQYIYHWALLPALIMLLLGMVRQEWLLVALAGVNVIAGLIHFRHYLPMFPAQQNQATATEGTELTFFTYNLGTNKTPIPALIDAINQVDADVVGLQELTEEQASQLETNLLDDYPYQLLKGMGIPGIGLLSKYPFVSAEFFYLDSENPYQYVVLDIDGVQIAIVNAHPPPQLTETRTDEYGWGSTDIPLLVKQIPVDNMPHVFLGDFNVTDQSQDYQRIRELGLEDAFHNSGRGMGFTFPAQPGTTLLLVPPVYRIDYVFHTSEFESIEAFRGPNAGSDHHSLVARLRLLIEAESSSKLPELEQTYEVEVAAFAGS